MKRFAIVVGLAFITVAAFAQDDVDTVEDDPDGMFENAGDTVATETAVDHRAALESEAAVRFKGLFTTSVSAGAGWIVLPVPADPSEGLALSAGLEAEARFSIDARPEPCFRVYADAMATMDPLEGIYDWGDLSFAELFCDYVAADLVYARIGKFVQTWGQGRIFAPGDLMDDADDGLGMRIQFPAFLDGLGFTALANEAFFAVPASPSPREAAVAALVEKTIGPVHTALGLRYRGIEGMRGLLSLKGVLLGADIWADIVLRYRSAAIGSSSESLQRRLLVGAFKEWDVFRAVVEYYYDGEAGEGHHVSGVQAALRRPAGLPFDIGLEWLHDYTDSSGMAVIGFEGTPLALVTVTLGFPVVYGDEGGRFVTLNEDPDKRRLAIGLVVKIARGF